MIIISVVAYIALVAWFLLGGKKSPIISTFVGVCISAFMAYWYWQVDNIATIIYIIMGIVCIFFHWISVDDVPNGKIKNKTVAALLAIFLGGYGAHKFYLKKSTLGLFYLLFCWSIIPSVIGIIEAIYLFAMSQEKFDSKYNTLRTPKAKAQKQTQNNPPPNYTAPENIHIDNKPYENINERVGDQLNYRDIRLCGYKAEAIGNVDNFTITVKANGKTYAFKTTNGDISSCRSSTMRGTHHYEVT